MNPFLKACGATGPLQLSVECQGGPRAESVTFDLPFVLIGRDPGADLHFLHQDVCARHVYLQMVAGHLCYMDLGSRTGTFLGGKGLRSGWVLRQKSIRVGPYRVRLVGGDAGEWAHPDRPPGASNGFAPPPFPDAATSPLSLELSHRGIRPAHCPLRGDLTLIGSSTDCDVRVLDPSVSNYHCSLLQAGGSVWVVDLLGREGVTVNGSTVRYARLDPGDELRVGHSLIRLRVAAEGAEAPRTVAFPAPLSVEMTPGPDLAPPVPAPNAETVFAAGPPALDQGALIEAILAPLSERFDMMQQQMFEQLHQAGRALIERFAAVQEEQVRALRHELEQFRGLTRELDALRAALAERAERPSGAAFPPRLGSATAYPYRPLLQNGALVLSRPEANENGHGNGHSNGNGNGNGTHWSEGPALRLGAAQERTTVEPEVRPDDPDRRHDGDIHAWLCQRISMIQREQQSGWQKILGMIPSQLLGKPTA